jgi:Membrane domain of glycerophosphoryl diester phosphodiesterase
MRGMPRPMTLGEILDRTVQIYRAKFWTYVAISSLPAITMFGIYTADDSWLQFHTLLHPTARNGIIAWNAVVALAFYHIATLVGLFFLPVFTWVTSRTYLEARATVHDGLGIVYERVAVYLKIGLAKFAAQMIGPEALAAGAALAAAFLADRAGAFDNNRGSLPAFTIFFVSLGGACVLFAWVGTCLSFAFPVSVLEGLPCWKSLKRSWQLSKGKRWQVFGVWFLFFSVSWILGYGLQRAFRWTLIFAYWRLHIGSGIFHHYLQAFRLLNAVFSAFVAPFYPIAATLIYYDQRVRKEAYDIELLMRAAGMDTEPPRGAAEYTGAVRK